MKSVILINQSKEMGKSRILGKMKYSTDFSISDNDYSSTKIELTERMRVAMANSGYLLLNVDWHTMTVVYTK